MDFDEGARPHPVATFIMGEIQDSDGEEEEEEEGG